MQSFEWRRLAPINKQELVAVRKQFHVGIQSVAAVGRKFLPHNEGDINATLVWVSGLNRMAGKWVEGSISFRSSISLDTFEVFLVDRKVTTIACISLPEKSQLEVMLWLEEQIGKIGLDAPALAINLPYPLPDYAATPNEQFLLLENEHSLELAKYYNNSYLCLRKLKEQYGSGSRILIWPHHFDQALQITLKDSGSPDTNTTISFGMSPGDEEFESPYFYVNTWPHVDTSSCKKLYNNAIWVSEEWTGAVLFAKHIIDGNQQEIVESFYREAKDQLTKLLIN